MILQQMSVLPYFQAQQSLWSVWDILCKQAYVASYQNFLTLTLLGSSVLGALPYSQSGGADGGDGL